MLGSLLAFGLPPGGSSYDPGTSNLSVWLRGDGVTGTGATLSWAGRASSGTSSGTTFLHTGTYDDEVISSSTQLDAKATVEWPVAGSYPQLVCSEAFRTGLLGQGDDAGASYTVGAVIQPLASNANGLSGGDTTASNAALLQDTGSYGRIASIHSDAKIGVYHYDGVGAVGEGIPPVAWPGGFGAWGLLWIVFDYVSGTTGTLRMRINGSDVATETLRVLRGSTGLDGTTTSGASGGGAHAAAFRLAELLVYPGQAFTGLQLATKETYFAARYPSLGL